MQRLIIIFIALTFLSGCSYFNVDRRILMPSGKVYTVNALKDDLVSFEADGLKITVDGRGRPGMIEQALGIMFMNLPDMTVVK